MNTRKYSVIEFLYDAQLDQLIVPELQRDYVWGVNEVMDLLKSINEEFNNGNGNNPYLGFIYAYTTRDYPNKYFLIDGQQRMTTIFLILLSCYHKLGKKLPDYIIHENRLKLDYKVRQETHDFLINLTSYILNNPVDYEFEIRNQIWYHHNYENDITISNVIKNYYCIRNWTNEFTEENLNKFLRFLEEKVELSYFNIDNGREGEELYIYMNSRGRQLEENETLKAKYLNRIDDIEKKLYWGKQWEIWNDFFWIHRDTNPDSDFGFNEFLRMIQIINMCNYKPPTEISDYTSPKTIQKLDIDLLPQNLDDIEEYFQAYKWLNDCKNIYSFFKVRNILQVLSTAKNHNQIEYFQLLPILALLKLSKLKDEDTVLRFIRFFFNIARKEKVSKDIANQLPAAVKLMLDYSVIIRKTFDVFDLIKYQGGRTVLIDDEEVFKLSFYKNPPEGSTRQELEILFWSAEDHAIFRGEINFLLNPYYNRDELEFKLNKYKKTWSSFITLFPINKYQQNNTLITIALLFYGNTWEQVSPYYYTNYDCQNWRNLVRKNSGKFLIKLLEDMHNQTIDYLDIIIKQKIKNHFASNSLTSIDALKNENDSYRQVQILAGIDYFSQKILWNNASHVAYDDRFNYDDKPFFNRNLTIFNINRYILDGQVGRVFSMMKNILQDSEKLNHILLDILS